MRSAASGGFFAPAEEAAHSRTWMCWPTTASIYTWPSRPQGYYEAVQETLGRLAATIAEQEPVTMLAAAELHPLVRRLCGPRVALLDVATDDMWARDSGPVFLIDGKGGKALVDFGFNAWGGKQAHSLDGRVAAAIAGYLGCPRLGAGIVGEGGGIEFDGEGTLLLNDSCWVNENRNPGKSRAEIEAALKRLLGVETVVWLPGIAGGDITDDHIDGTTRFVRPGLVLMSGISGDRSDYGRCYREAKAILRAARDARGRSFEIVELPYAEIQRSTEPDFFAGYANFYVGNGAVYTPEFGDAAADARAVETLAALFPGRRVISLNVDRIYENGGGIHCVTQQEPAV